MGWFSRRRSSGESHSDTRDASALDSADAQLLDPAEAPPLDPADAQLLDVLAQSSDLERPRDWIHFLSLPDEAVAHVAFLQATAAGWVGYGDIDDNDGSTEWSVSVRRDDLAVSADSVSAARAFFTRLAAEGGGIYDGWEAATDEAPEPQQPSQQQPLDDADTAWLMSLWEEAAQLGIDDSPDALESFCSQRRNEWWAAPESERTDPRPIIALIGAVAGRMIAEATGLEWALFSDEHGTELGLVPADGPDIGVFPLDVVARIWDGQSRSTVDDFIVTASRQISAALSEAED